MITPPDPRIDDLRQRLRSLGYLEAGVDRFVLSGAAHTGGPLAFAARASARVGLLGGALLGPAGALGLGARLPGLVSGPRDAAVLSIYLAVFFFVAVSAAAFAAGAIAASVAPRADGRFAARARRLSSAAGILAAACLGYLTLWWRNANAGFGWSAPVWTAFALLVAVTISLLLGHAVRIATLGVLATSAGPSAAIPPVTSLSWPLSIGIGLFAFAGAAVLLIISAPSASGAAPPALTVVSTGTRVRLIALDGFDMASYLNSEQGASRFSSAMHGAALLHVQDTGDPARAWTTVATGVPPERHGVRGIQARRVAGVRGILSRGSGDMAELLGAATDVLRLTRPGLTSREERRVKTFWEAASAAGLRTAVVNWWATWPAAGSAIVVSDRAMVRLERGGALDAEIAPASLYEDLRRAWPAIRQRAEKTAAEAFPYVRDARMRAALQRSAALDVTVLEILRALPGPPRDLDVVYLPGLDIAQHALLASDAPGSPAASALTARIAAIGAYYEFLQQLVEPLLAEGGDVMTIVLTQPGRVATPTDGHLAALGSPGQPAPRATGSALDVAPTLLYALGMPLSRELPGAPLQDLFTSPFVQRHAARYVSTYGAPANGPAAREGKPLDQEMIDRLRSLGYVK